MLRSNNFSNLRTSRDWLQLEHCTELNNEEIHLGSKVVHMIPKKNNDDRIGQVIDRYSNKLNHNHISLLKKGPTFVSDKGREDISEIIFFMLQLHY